MAHSSTDPADAIGAERGPPVEHPFAFTGTAAEYFRIWIVNLALTLLTFGIYGPWAKVRTNRYFYGATRVAGHGFGYHADPRAILLGRIIALVILGALAACSELLPPVAGFLSLGLALLIPEAIRRSLRFRARNTSYRNVRFGFTGSYGEALVYYVFMYVVTVLTLGLLWPLMIKLQREWHAANHRYGQRHFEPSFKVSHFYGASLYAGLIAAAGFTIAVIATLGLAAAGREGSFSANLLILLIFAGTYYLAYGSFTASLTNIVYSNVSLDGNRFASELSGARLGWLYLSNTAAIIASLGLLIPWARIRVARYRAACTTLVAATDLDRFAAGEREKESAIGEEFGELLDLEIGF